MAGVDKDFFGDAKPADGTRIGFLPQEPALDSSKTVLGNVEEAVANTKRLLTRFDEVNAKLGEDLKPGEMEKLLDEQGKLQDAIEAANGWDRDGRPPPAPRRRGRRQAVGRRAQPGGAVPRVAGAPRPSVAGRVDQPPGR